MLPRDHGKKSTGSGERKAEAPSVGSLHSHNRRRRHASDTTTAVRGHACALLAVDHLKCCHEAAGDQEHDVVTAPCAVAPKLRPVQLVAHGKVAAPAALEVPLLEAVVAGHDLGGALLVRGEEQAVVAVRRRAGLVRGREGHDVCLVL